MSHNNIGILCDSDIVRLGIVAILHSIKEFSPIVTELTYDRIEDYILMRKPSVIIIQCETVSIRELNHIVSLSQESPTRLIGINMAPVNPDKAHIFSSLISVNDSIESVREKITKATASKPATTSSALTSREKEIIIGIVKGLSNKEIASAINVSVNTVMTHRRNIAAKLQIHSAAGLTIYALASKLVSLDEVKSSIDL